MELLFLFFLLSLLSPAAVTARDTITPTTPLSSDQTLVSSDSAFALGFFSLSSGKHYLGVWFNVTDRQYIWVANRDRAVTGSNFTLSISSTGTLSLTDGGDSAVWSASPPSPLANPVAQLLNTGNLVIKESSSAGAAAWQSFWHPTDTIVTDMDFGVNRTTGFNTTLTSWLSGTDPSPGPVELFPDLTSDPQLFLTRGGEKLWRWTMTYGVYFAKIKPGINLMTFNWHYDADAVIYSYHFALTAPSMLRLNNSGELQFWIYTEGTGWYMADYQPNDPCERTSACGANSVCTLSNTTASGVQCSCLPGFAPASGGRCELPRRLQCGGSGNTGDFETVKNAMLPDTTGTATNRSMGLGECRAACLRNCSCTAYAATSIIASDPPGCVMWFGDLVDLRTFPEDPKLGQDLFIRVSAEESSSGGASTALIFVLCVVGFLLLVAVIAFFLWRRSRRQTAPASNSVVIPELLIDDSADNGDDMNFPLLDLATVALATDNFSPANKLGQGGFGAVYKGTLPDGQEIAVKRNAVLSPQGIKEFKNEVELIAKLQHKNLVRLIGCAIYGEERMLVYEYMPNKSLDHFIFDQAKNKLLNWQVRHQIILGIARGLQYLHEDSRLKIIHRDLKTSNILLDKDMNPKISDFGIARTFDNETEINTRRVVGTYGYISPEYALEGMFSVKSDVFSFGVVVLEIISGRKNRGGHFPENLNLVEYAWKLWKEGNIEKLIDESMDHSYPREEVLKCIKVALLCVQENPEDRPLMSSVISMLNRDDALVPEPKKSGYTVMKGHNNSESTGNQYVDFDGVPITVNSEPITILEAR